MMSPRIEMYLLGAFLLIVAQCESVQRFYKTEFIEMPLDHFSFANNRTFKLRYLINDTFWDKENGPVLLYTGNEGTIEVFAEHTGLMWKMAPDMHALIVFAEHRYYGKSLPFGNESLHTNNIGYLTSTQALADYAQLMTTLLKDRPMNQKNPVIAFGGSYGGMLAAYMRMKYPHIVTGAIAASAPILQFKDLTTCDSFYRVLTSAYNVTDHICTQNIRNSWAAINNKTSSAAGREWITRSFKLCKPLNESNVPDFKSWLVDIYGNLGMMNYPYECNYLAPLPAYPVRTMCFNLKDPLTGDKLLEALFSSISIFTNYTGKAKCNDLNNDDINGIDAGAWDYQACSEMVMPMCMNGTTDMFEPTPWDEEKFNAGCMKRWNVKPNYMMPITEYGGKNLKYASNIIFSNGLLDPWASGGVLRNFGNSVMAFIIPEGAHHLDLMEDNKNDPYSVTYARKYYQNTIMDWIKTARN